MNLDELKLNITEWQKELYYDFSMIHLNHMISFIETNIEAKRIPKNSISNCKQFKKELKEFLNNKEMTDEQLEYVNKKFKLIEELIKMNKDFEE